MLSAKHLGTKEALCKKGWGEMVKWTFLGGVYTYNSSIYLSLLLGVGFSILMQRFLVFTCVFLAIACVLDACRKCEWCWLVDVL